MPDLPPIKPGHVRLHLLLDHDREITPGDLLRATGLDPELIDNVLVFGHEAMIDIVDAHGQCARKALDAIGITQVTKRPQPPPRWSWIKITVGRNHGLSMRQLRKILERADAGQVGQIDIHNTHTAIGIRDDRIDAVLERLAALRINGIQTRPERQESRRAPASRSP